MIFYPFCLSRMKGLVLSQYFTSQLHTLCHRNTCLIEDLPSFPGILNCFQDLLRPCVEMT